MSAQARTTIQDIADALGLSRNTVSKALNNYLGMPEDTRQRVLDKAREMNYKSMGVVASKASSAQPTRDILLICSDAQTTSSFFQPLIQTLLTDIRQHNAVPVVQFLGDEDIENGRIAQSASNAAGVMALEALAAPYIRRLLDTGKPVVFFDYHSQLNVDERPFDIVLSDMQPMEAMIRRMFDNGARSFGFAGDPKHCLGFTQRWNTFQTVTRQLGVRTGPEYDIYAPGDVLHCMDDKCIADAYFCANDYNALELLKRLKEKGVRVPMDVQVCGFDNIPECTASEPSLSTVAVDPERLASAMSLLLFDRIEHPEQERRIMLPRSRATYRETVR